jgi:hypothetical protein
MSSLFGNAPSSSAFIRQTNLNEERERAGPVSCVCVFVSTTLFTE